MYINITASETGNNKGSSGALVHYLEKENDLKNGKNPYRITKTGSMVLETISRDRKSELRSIITLQSLAVMTVSFS
ncbi:DUF5712 family protein [Pedobacter steynii]